MKKFLIAAPPPPPQQQQQQQRQQQQQADPDTVLKQLGYDAWRPHQREAVAAALQKRDALVVLPTGGGKSLCFIVPALATAKGALPPHTPSRCDALTTASTAAAASAVSESRTPPRRRADRRGQPPAKPDE